MTDPNLDSDLNSQDQIKPTAFDAPATDSLKQSGFKWSWRHSLLLTGSLLVLLLIIFMVSAKAILITTNAENSLISLSGGTSLKLGNGRYLVIKDSYRLRLQAQGYEPLELSLEVNSDTLSNLNYELTPLPGRIRARFAMNSQNEETVKGVVRLNGSGMGPANEFLFKDLQPGEYRMRADAYLYEPKELDILVRGREITEEITLELDPNWGYLIFNATPEDAQLYVGNQQLETQTSDGRQTARVESGTSTLTIKRQGYKDWQSEISVQKEQQIDLGSILLEPVDTQYSINTNPSGVSVTVNGEYAGQTPVTLDLLPDTAHQLKLFKAGYLSQQHQIKVARNSIETRDFELVPDLVSVSISVSPQNARVSVNGVSIDKLNSSRNANGSYTLALPSIKHKVNVSADGYADKTLDLLPVKGSGQLLKVQLLTDEQALWASTPGQYTGIAGNNMLLFRDAGLVPMGSSRREPGRRANEVQWNADLRRAFYVSTTETTNKQYRLFESEHSSGHWKTLGLDGPERPAVGMSWQKAALYCNWLSERSGLEPFYTVSKGFVSGANPKSTGYRLLTEAEWTYLAKITPAGIPQRYVWGDSDQPPNKFENFADQSVAGKINFILENNNDGFAVSAPVASFASNSKGIYDLGGNVMEWMHDWYQPIPYETGAEVSDPLGPSEGEFHVIRGASWGRGYLPQLRVAYRDYDSRGRNDLGFRIARYAM